MKERKLKKQYVVMFSTLAVVLVLGVVYAIEGMISNNKFQDDGYYEYVDSDNQNHYPVISQEVIVSRPYKDPDVGILKNYYDHKSDEETQKKSIIHYDQTYIQNSGVCYGNKEIFDVVSILDGTVIDIKEDKLLGKIVQIKHEKDIVSVYQSLSETSVNKDDVVKQGQLVGRSGTSNINKDLPPHVNFEIILKGQLVNPETLFNKNITEI